MRISIFSLVLAIIFIALGATIFATTHESIYWAMGGCSFAAGVVCIILAFKNRNDSTTRK